MSENTTEQAVESCQQRADQLKPNSWVIWIWVSQLAIPLVPLVYAAFRWHHQLPFRWWILALAVCCGIWTVAVIGTLVTRAGRVRLLAHRWQVVLALVTSVITVGLCDVVLSISGTVPTLAAQRSISLLYRPAVSTRHRLIPNRRTLGKGEYDIVINRRGLRGPDVPVPDTNYDVQVLILGGSHVFDFDGANWPALAQELLDSSNQRVRIINAGVPGHSTADSLGKLVTDLWLMEPDIIVVCQSYNDLKYFSQVGPERPYRDVVVPYQGDPRMFPSGVDRLLCVSSLYRLGRSSFWGTVYGTIYGAVGGAEGFILEPSQKINSWGVRQFRLNLETICDVGTNLGAQVVLCKQARLATQDSPESDRSRMNYAFTGLEHDEYLRAFGECDRVIDEVAAEKRCLVIDMHEPLSGTSECFKDHIHFTPHGSHQAARVFAEALESMFFRQSPRSQSDKLSDVKERQRFLALRPLTMTTSP